MKQKYYSMAPDISAGGTTINDVGEQTYSRKRFNLWSFLLCLMAMVLPVGAWGQDEGTTSDHPWTGTIGYKEISKPGNYYLQNVTSGEKNEDRSRIRITVEGVTLHVAGYNYLRAQRNGAGAGNNNYAAIDIGNINNFTIKHWEGTENNNNKDFSVLDLKAHSAPAINNNRPAIQTNGNTNVTIEGPIAVYAKSSEVGDGGTQRGGSTLMSGATVTLQNGAYFEYDDPKLQLENQDRFSNPSNWEIIGFAFAGDEAYKQIKDKISQDTYTEMIINAGSLYDDLAKPSLNGTAYLYGTIGNGHFVVPAKPSFNLFVNNNVNTPYGEVATNTENVNYPFPIHTDNTADSRILTEVNVGAAVASSTYYGQLNGQTKGDFKLNVAQYPHAGTLNASTGNITLEGTKEYNKLHTVSEGFNLSASANHTLTLTGITIPANNKVYVSGDVRLGTGCSISDDVVKFRTNGNEVSVYYCQINYMNTELAKPDVEIEIENNDKNYPYAIDTYQKIIYMWLPVGNDGKDLTFKVKGSGTGYQIRDNITNLHNQQHYLAAPVIYIGDVSYNTLSAAFENVKDGEIIRFEGDYTAVDGGEAVPSDANITTGSSFTLNLNGHTLTIGGEQGLPLISGGNGKLILEGGSGVITGNYQIGGKGGFYTTLNTPGNAHVGNTRVTPKQISTDITKQNSDAMPSVITYQIGSETVYAAKNDDNTSTEYCVWLPTENNSYDVKDGDDEDAKIFARINNNMSGTPTITPLFDLDCDDITVGSTGVKYAGSYQVNGYGTQDIPAEIVTVGQNNYHEERTLTVHNGTYVVLKDIYSSMLYTNGKDQNDKDIKTKLVTTGTDDAYVMTSGVNSMGSISIGNGSKLVLNQITQEPAQANILRFFTLTGEGKDNSTLSMEGGTLLTYINDKEDVEKNTISNVKAIYKTGSVRAKFETNADSRFVDEQNKELYRITFGGDITYYAPYTYEYSENGVTKRVPLTSDKNGEIHIWLPEGTEGTAKFARSGEASITIPYGAVKNDDSSEAPVTVEVYEGTQLHGTYISLSEAFNKIKELANSTSTNQQFEIKLLIPHTESNTTCEVPANTTVTINLQGHDLTCEHVEFKTDETNFLLITNDVTDANSHSQIKGEIIISQNVYISRSVHMANVHVTDEEDNTVYRMLVTGINKDTEYTYNYNGAEISFTVGMPKRDVTDGEGVACLWPIGSPVPFEFFLWSGDKETPDVTLTVPGIELAATTHFDNYLTLVSLPEGSFVAKVNNKEYRTLSKAIEAANKKEGDITLLTDVQPQATYEITESYSIDLDSHNLSFTQGGFNVNNGKTLTIEGANSNLTGVINLKGDGTVKVEEEVLIGGVVMKHENNGNIKTVYRLIVENDDASQNVWVETPERNTDVQYGTSTKYEYTIPAGLANHSTKVTAYKVVEVNETTDWDAVNGCNVVVNKDVTWNITTGNGTIHRLTIHENGKVVTGSNTKITATDGIRYVRSFTEDQWTLIALPFTSTDITTVIGDKVVSLSPAANPGTSGHFWLHTIKNDGTTTDVTSSEMTANEVYVMKVPKGFSGEDKAITFISGPNQMLHRNRVLNPSPISGFVAYANGTLDDVDVEKAYYKLDDTGENFVRVDEPDKHLVSPFSGYLLADAKTTETITIFGLRSTPTANEDIEVPADKLQIRTQPGRIILTADEPIQVVICDVAGVVKFQGEIPAGDSAYEVGAGIHIVNNQKVIVW